MFINGRLIEHHGLSNTQVFDVRLRIHSLNPRVRSHDASRKANAIRPLFDLARISVSA